MRIQRDQEGGAARGARRARTSAWAPTLVALFVVAPAMGGCEGVPELTYTDDSQVEAGLAADAASDTTFRAGAEDSGEASTTPPADGAAAPDAIVRSCSSQSEPCKKTKDCCPGLQCEAPSNQLTCIPR